MWFRGARAGGVGLVLIVCAVASLLAPGLSPVAAPMHGGSLAGAAPRSAGPSLGPVPTPSATPSGPASAAAVAPTDPAVAASSSLGLFSWVSASTSPFGEAYDVATSQLYVANSSGNDVTVLTDPGLQTVAEVTVGSAPFEIAYDSGKGELFVGNSGDGTVSVISDSTHTVTATIPVGGSPWGLAYAPSLGFVFVATFNGSTVLAINDSTDAVAFSVNTGSLPLTPTGPAGLAFDSGTSELYVAAWYSSVVVAFAVNHTVIQYATQIAVDTAPDEVAYDPQTSEIYVSCHASSGFVDVISDASSHTRTARVAVGSNPIGLAYDPALGDVVVANAGSANASVISAASHTVVQTVSLLLGGGPSIVAYDPTTGALFVSDTLAGAVIVVLPVYPVAYSATGLPALTNWILRLNGTTTAGYHLVNDSFFSAPGSGSISLAAGSYSFAVAPVSGYTAVPQQGTLTVPSAGTLTIVFSRLYQVTFQESGLPSGANWSVDLGGTVAYSTSTSLSVTKTNGTYPFTVSGPAGFLPNATNGSVTVAGANVTRTLSFTAVYTVAFTERGLPSGTSWSVTLAGKSQSSSAATINFSEPTGSYPFQVGVVQGYNATPTSGTVYVTAADTAQAVNFTVYVPPSPHPNGTHPSNSSPGLLGLPGSEGLIVLVAIVVVVAAVAGFLAMRRGRMRPPKVEPGPAAEAPTPSQEPVSTGAPAQEPKG